MNRIAFKMQLITGNENEYKKRHEAIWPELSELLKKSDISEYSIFLDEDTGSLFGFLKISIPSKLDELPNYPIMQKWWAFMKDIMVCHPDNSPLSIPLQEVFYLP